MFRASPYWISITLLAGELHSSSSICTKQASASKFENFNTKQASITNDACKDQVLPDDTVSLLMKSFVVKAKSFLLNDSSTEAGNVRGLENRRVLTNMNGKGWKEPTNKTEWPYMFRESLHCGKQGRSWHVADSMGGASALWANTSEGESEQLFSVPIGFNITGQWYARQQQDIIGPTESTSSHITSKFLGMTQSFRSRVKELHQVYVTWRGDIFKPETCQTWCIVPRGYRKAHCQNNSMELQMDSPVVDNVVSLAGFGMAITGIYHGPIDIISSLVHVNKSILRSNSTLVHIPFQSTYTMEWLDIVGIPRSKVLQPDQSNAWAKHLYVPHWTFHFPSSMQYQWLQEQVWSAIGIPDVSSRNRLIVIKRSTRGVSNHEKGVLPLAFEYASSHGLQVHVHDDQDLPSVREQLRVFADAKIIVAPHGAGESFTIATAPGACLIEMFKPCFTPNDFARQSTFLGLHYVALALRWTNHDRTNHDCQHSNAPVDVEELRTALQKCSNAMEI